MMMILVLVVHSVLFAIKSTQLMALMLQAAL